MIEHSVTRKVPTMRLHLYTAGDPAPTTHADLPDDRRVREIVEIEGTERVFRLGSDIEIDPDLTVIEAFGPGGNTAVKHSCRNIAVSVDYAGRRILLEHVHPAVRVSDVEKRALRQLEVDPSQSASLELRRRGTEDVLNGPAPIGAYVKHGECQIELDLVPVKRNQG